MGNDTDNNDELTLILRDIRTWCRAGFFGQVQQLLEKTLPDPKHRKAYQMADGVVRVKDVAQACSMAPANVLKTWSLSERRGLMEPLPGGKHRRLFDLRDFDMVEGSAVKIDEVGAEEQ